MLYFNPFPVIPEIIAGLTSIFNKLEAIKLKNNTRPLLENKVIPIQTAMLKIKIIKKTFKPLLTNFFLNKYLLCSFWVVFKVTLPLVLINHEYELFQEVFYFL